MKKLRTLLVAAAVAIGGGVSPLTMPAEAHGPISYEIHYYDSNFQYEAGYWIIYCDQHEAHWGYPDVQSWWAEYECP